MKTHTIKFVIVLGLLIVSNVAIAQSLYIDGRYLNESEKKIKVTYTLISDHKVIKTGRRRKIKIKLELNKNYYLLVSKAGYKPKSINFSTNANYPNDFTFSFDVVLKKAITRAIHLNFSENKNIFVFYDRKTEAFNYCYVNKFTSIK